MRLVRDVLGVMGSIQLGRRGAVKRVVLNSATALERTCAKAMRVLLETEHVGVTLGET
jgi:hypothetical protein